MQPQLKQTNAMNVRKELAYDEVESADALLLMDALLRSLKDASFYYTVRNETARSGSMAVARATLRELTETIDADSGVVAKNLHSLLRFMLYSLDTADRRKSIALSRELTSMLQPIRDGLAS